MSGPDLQTWLEAEAKAECPTCGGKGYHEKLIAVKGSITKERTPCRNCQRTHLKMHDTLKEAARRARQQAATGDWRTRAQALEHFADSLEALGQGTGETCQK